MNIDKLKQLRLQQSDFHYSDMLVSWDNNDNYTHMDRRIIHSLGLTEPILARTEMPSAVPAFKTGLIPMAEDIASVYRMSDKIGRGMFRESVKQHRAARWIEANLDAIEIIEMKMFNRHDLLENFRLTSHIIRGIDPNR